MIINGKQVFAAPHLTEQFRFPRSRAKRIRKKWSKRPENHRPSPHAYITAVGIFIHPFYYEELAKATSKR